MADRRRYCGWCWFLDGLRQFGKKARVCNMHTERLLIMIMRASDGQKAVFLERYLSDGYLVQWLTEHTSHGGSDPRVETHGKLVNEGVLLHGEV